MEFSKKKTETTFGVCSFFGLLTKKRQTRIHQTPITRANQIQPSLWRFLRALRPCMHTLTARSPEKQAMDCAFSELLSQPAGGTTRRAPQAKPLCILSIEDQGVAQRPAVSVDARPLVPENTRGYRLSSAPKVRPMIFSMSDGRDFFIPSLSQETRCRSYP